MGKQQLLKAHNRATILNTIRKLGAVSRADLARLTGLSVGAVTGLTTELINDGLIFEKQEGDSRGGRRPILLALQSAGVYVIGIKITEDHITFALTNLDADVLDRLTLTNIYIEPEILAQQIAVGIRQLIDRTQISPSHLIGVGIGLAGIIDAENGICRMSPILGWKNVPFAGMVEQCTDFPVYIDNDVNTLTLVEMLYGAGRGVEHFLTVTIGRGVGLGIVANGQLYRGQGGAGEFGHTTIAESGHLCKCGKRGCLETLIGDPWLVKHAQAQGLSVTTTESLLNAAQAGNPVATRVLADAGNALGRGVAMLVNILNPEMIIFSGEGMRYGELLLTPMRTALGAYVMPGLFDAVRLRTEPLGDDTWARGAASLVWQELFRSPEPTMVRAKGV